MKQILLLSFLIILCFSPICWSNRNADELLPSRMRTPLLKVDGSLTGEGLCWHAAYNMNAFMNEYNSTLDRSFLDSAIRYYDALLAKTRQAPDGYKGWVGPYIYDENYICDAHIGDAILINPMLEFCETVLNHEDPAIQQSYSSKAKEYLKFAQKHLIEKWDQRGTWYEDGPYGAYRSWDHYMTKDNLSAWRVLPAIKSNLTLPFNKQNSMAIACLRIYRITKIDKYHERALKIFNFMKSRMCLYQDHYVWNYWEPFGTWDIDFSSPNTLRHWVNVHPYRNYQAGEIYEIVEAYHSGLTFTKEDIQRIINTNLKVMWNGDRENPKWRNSNYGVQMASLGKILITKAPGGEFPKLAGTIWRGLADFDVTIRELANINDQIPVTFNRHFEQLPVTELQRPFNSNCYLSMVAAIPSNIKQDKKSFLISQSRVKGNVDIALYSRDGQKKVLDIRKQKSDSITEDDSGIIIVEWDSSLVPVGDYLIRWTLKESIREFPISVQ